MPDQSGRTLSPRHNHLTRDIKLRGQCPGCDEYHASRLPFVSIDAHRRDPSTAATHYVACSECGSLGDYADPQGAVNVRLAHLNYHEREADV